MENQEFDFVSRPESFNLSKKIQDSQNILAQRLFTLDDFIFSLRKIHELNLDLGLFFNITPSDKSPEDFSHQSNNSSEIIDALRQIDQLKADREVF